MAARVNADSSDELTVAYRRLNAAYQQTLRYAEDVRHLYQQVQRAIYQSLLGLANALEAKDAYTKGHSERVGAWSRGVATALGLPPADVDLIGQAGLLHDIGKIGIPEAVITSAVTARATRTGSPGTRFPSAPGSSRSPTFTTR